MGNVILISGPSGSGKSRFAEELISRTQGRRYYIATMIAQTEDNRRRIEKHRLQRAGLAFTTLERPYTVGDAPVEPDSVVLLEDLSNLLANNLFARGMGADTVLEDILTLSGRCGVLAAVTISGLHAGKYEGETADYIRELERLNRLLYELADAAAQMVDGAPVVQKGALNVGLA